MDTSIFVNLSDDDFRVKAFAEYCSRAQERFAGLISTFSDIDSYIDEDIEELPDDNTINQMVSQIMSDHDISDSVLSFEDGYASTRDVIKATLVNFIKDDIDEDDDDHGVYADNLEINFSDATGSITTSKIKSYASICDDLKSQMHSITCLTAACTSYAENISGTLSDAITVFNDKVKDVFNNPNSDISNTTQYLKSLLSEKNPTVFLQGCLQKIGILKQANATSEDPVYPNNNDMSDITGTSPAGPLNFSSSLKIVTSVGKAAAVAVAGIAVGIWNLGKTLFNKAFAWLRETLVDPNDLETINNKGFNTVEGFQYQDNFYGYVDRNLLQTAEKYIDKWIAFKTRFGEYCVKITHVTDAQDDGCMIDYQATYKPRVINFSVANSCLIPWSGVVPPNRISFVDVAEMLSKCAAQGSNLYNINGLSERDVYRGLILSIQLDMACFNLARAQIHDDDSLGYYEIPSGTDHTYDCEWSVYHFVSDNNYGNIPSTITNLDWVKAFSGYNTTFSNSPFILVPYRIHPVYVYSGDAHYLPISNCLRIIDGFLTVMKFEDDYPELQSPFIPFSNNHTDFNEPSFRIKTDSQNRDAFNRFVTTAIIVVVVAIVAISAVVLIKKIARAKYFKRATIVGQMDDAMWHGKVPDPKDQKKYVRAYKRMNRSSVLDGGFTNPISAPDNQSAPVNIDSVLPYIIDLSNR